MVGATVSTGECADSENGTLPAILTNNEVNLVSSPPVWRNPRVQSSSVHREKSVHDRQVVKTTKNRLDALLFRSGYRYKSHL